MSRLLAAGLVAGTLCSFAAAASTAQPKPIALTMGTTVATPGDEVSVRGRAQQLRLYLVPQPLAAQIRSRFDPRVSFVGVLNRGRSTFTVPPLDSGAYALAYWCRKCAQRGRTLVVARARPLQVQMPSARETCPVSKPNGKAPPGLAASAHVQGNGLLGALIGDSVYSTGPDGISFQKLIWIAPPTESGALAVAYRRIDAQEPVKRSQVIEGRLSTFAGRSWASRLYLTPGCWKVTGRLRDLSLGFVVEVVNG